MTELEIIGTNIRIAREKRGITQSRLAEEIDISISHMSDIENGKKEMGVVIFKKITDALSVSGDKLMQNEIWSAQTELNIDVISLFCDCSLPEQQYLLRTVEYAKQLYNEFQTD